MRKILIFCLIFFLIIFTSFIKNSTKNLDSEIYSVRENLILLENRLKDTKLEFNYLSSSEKLLEFQSLYFENDLVQKKIENIKVFKITNKDKKIENLKIIKD